MKPKSLSDLEQQVMNIIWEANSCSVREVMEKLRPSRRLAYTTVATILYRLHEKGLITKKGKGIAFVYSPKLTKEAYSKTMARSFIDKFFNAFGDVAITSFAQSIDTLPKEKKEYLLELLEDYDKAK